MKTYNVTVTVEVPDVEAEDVDDAINLVTEAIEDTFSQTVSFSGQTATTYDDDDS